MLANFILCSLMKPDIGGGNETKLATGGRKAMRENGYMIAMMIEFPVPLGYLIHRIALQNKRGNPELVVYISISDRKDTAIQLQRYRSARRIQTDMFEFSIFDFEQIAMFDRGSLFDFLNCVCFRYARRQDY